MFSEYYREDKKMIFVIQCEVMKDDTDLKKMQNHFLGQIREGCLVLPPNCKLVQVVEARSNNDIEIIDKNGSSIDYVPVLKRR